MDPDGARLLGEPDHGVLHRLRRDHHQVGELVDHDEDVRESRLAALAEGAVRLVDVAGAHRREALVAALHLGEAVGEDGARLLRARDDGREEVRHRLEVAELDPLRVDEDQPHVVGRRAQEDGREERVEAARLARAGGAGDEQVRHAREVGPDGGAGDVLAEPDGDRARRRGQRLEDVAERDEVRREVRQLDADRLLAGDRREDPDLGRGERVREVVLQRRDLGDLRPRRELQLVARHARARDLADHRRLDAEVRERLHEELRDARSSLARVVALLRRDAEDAGVRQLVLRVLRRHLVEERRRILEQSRRLGLERSGLRAGVRRHEALPHDVREGRDGVDRRRERRSGTDRLRHTLVTVAATVTGP